MERDVGKIWFGDARAYIGTMFEVTSIEAKELATVFFTKYSESLLPIALWRSQNDVYGETRHPYVTLGTHFTRIRFGRSNIIKYRAHAYNEQQGHGEIIVSIQVRRES